jgi:hypothetical protein
MDNSEKIQRRVSRKEPALQSFVMQSGRSCRLNLATQVTLSVAIIGTNALPSLHDFIACRALFCNSIASAMMGKDMFRSTLTSDFF